MIHDDQPISGVDEHEDRLDRGAFATRIVEGLQALATDANLTVSIEAPWGAGKTSVINLIKAKLATAPKEKLPIIVNFNPWVIGHFEQLAQGFIVQLAAALELNDHAGNGKKAATELIAYSKVFDVVKLIPGAEPWATIVKTVVESVGGATEKISELKTLDLAKRKTEVEKALKAMNKRIVVFIDDLDRLPPEDVAEMIRLIKAVGDFPYIVYVLAFDCQYVERALSTRGIPGSESYLDKIVQVRLHLPQVDKNQLMQLVDDEYALLPDEAKQAFTKTDDRVSEVIFYGAGDLIETPRDVKRLFNRLVFSEPPCRGEVALGDLLALELIALKAPSVYRHIRDEPEAYVGKPLFQTFSVADVNSIVSAGNERRGHLIGKLPIGIRRPLLNLIRHLFPLTANDNFNQKDNANAQGLVQDPSRLASALAAGVPSKEAPLKHAYAIVKNPTIRETILNEALATSRLPSLLNHLSSLIDEEVIDLPGFAVSLGKAIDAKEARELNGSDNFSLLPPIRLAWNFLEEKLNQTQTESIFPVILAMTKNRDCVSLSTQALRNFAGQLSSSGKSKQNCKWGSDQDWRDAVEHWSSNVTTWISAGKLHQLALGTMVLKCYIEWVGSAAQAQLNTLLSSEEGTDQVMLTFTDNGAGGKGSFLHLDDESLEAFGGRMVLTEVARNRLADPKLSHRLRVVYQAILTGKRVYSADGSIDER